jgi:REP element-mobilizing transposase RayT
MRNRRYFRSGSVHFVTFRTEEGLPFVQVRFINMLMLSALARAKQQYPVQLIAVVVQANHVHMLIRVLDPAEASAFIGYFKTETSNCLNRLLNRRQRTVWAKRFDSPMVLDFEKALELFSYTLLNPVKDGLVDSMTEYPGVSSYQALIHGQNELVVKSIPRSAVKKLADPTRPLQEDRSLSQYFASGEFADIKLQFEPEALRLAYAETRDLSVEQFREKLIESLQAMEAELRREQIGRRPLGACSLISASMLTRHEPPISGRRMICVSSIPESRRIFIPGYRHLDHQCAEVFNQWKQGNISVPFPPGMFAPGMPRLANILPLTASGRVW